MLQGMVATSIADKKTDLSKNVMSDLSYNNFLSAWVASVNAKLDKDLSGAAMAGRNFFIVESPIIINPGKLANDATSFGGKSLHYEAAFRDYLKSLYDPAAHFTKDDIDVTEIVPPRPAVSSTPTLPQNVKFRYRFSW